MNYDVAKDLFFTDLYASSGFSLGLSFVTGPGFWSGSGLAFKDRFFQAYTSPVFEQA